MQPARTVCKDIVNMGVAKQVCKPKRAIGTVFFIRAVCEKARDVSNVFIAVMRINRLRIVCIRNRVDNGMGIEFAVIE